MDSATTPATIQETKRTLDGRRQTFACGLLAVEARRALVRFDHTQARTVSGFHFPAGSYTLGLFWRGRHYNVYRITGPDDRLIAYRFDVVDAVNITPTHIGYTDLLLDAWLSPSGQFHIEDEDEVAAAEAACLLSPRRRAIIAATERLLSRAHRRIAAEAEREIAALTAPAQTIP